MSDDIARLRQEAAGLPYGPTKIALLDEAVHLADSINDLDLGFAARKELMLAADYGGRPDLLLVAFSWCLAQHDRDAPRFSRHNILWQYKWVVSRAPQFPQITLRQIDELLDDMTERYRRAGSTLHAVHDHRCKLAHHLGDADALVRSRDLLLRTERDWLSDCRACVADNEIMYLLFLQRDDEALAAAEPILRGRLKCIDVPHRTLARLLLPLVRLGRADQAKDLHRRGYPLVRANPSGQLSPLAEHIVYLTLTQLRQAARTFERFLPVALTAVELDRRFEFFRAGRFLLRVWMEQSPPQAWKLRLPVAAKGDDDAEDPVPQDPDRLADWLDERLDDLARQFDDRNGNNHFRQQLGEPDEWHKLVQTRPHS